MQHDLQLRAAARVIYDTCQPIEDWHPIGFEEAERRKTPPYLQAVDAALRVRPVFANYFEQPALI